MTVNNTTANLNEPLQIYQHDRGIVLRIQVLRYKYTFNKLQEENMVAETGILSARAIVLKPDGKRVFECPKQDIEDDLVIINITLDWTDELTEIGKYKLQVQLYGRDPINERVTLPPVEFTVAPMIGYVPEEGVNVPAYAEAAFLDNDYLADAIGEVDDGDLPYGIYDKTTWEPGDILTAEELNKSEKAIEYLVRTQKAKAVYLPTVNADGLISWTNDLEYDNPEPINIMGPQGPVGPQGPQGEKGEDGTSIKILGTVSTVQDLQSYVNSSEPGDSYLVTSTGDTWVFTPSGVFINVGPVQGRQGPKGDKGDKGDPFTYEDLTPENKADLTQGFITCSDNIKRIEMVRDYPTKEEDGVLYIKVEGI